MVCGRVCGVWSGEWSGDVRVMSGEWCVER